MKFYHAPLKMRVAPQMPPQIPRPGAATVNDVFTSAQTVVLRDGVCRNLSFQNIFGGNFCFENLPSI